MGNSDSVEQQLIKEIVLHLKNGFVKGLHTLDLAAKKQPNNSQKMKGYTTIVQMRLLSGQAIFDEKIVNDKLQTKTIAQLELALETAKLGVQAGCDIYESLEKEKEFGNRSSIDKIVKSLKLYKSSFISILLIYYAC